MLYAPTATASTICPDSNISTTYLDRMDVHEWEDCDECEEIGIEMDYMTGVTNTTAISDTSIRYLTPDKSFWTAVETYRIRSQHKQIDDYHYDKFAWTTRGYQTCASTTTTTVLIKNAYTNYASKVAMWYSTDSPKCEWVVSRHHASLSDRMQGIIAARVAPAVITNRKAMPKPDDIREQRARQTLLRVVGEEQYRSYLRQGFVSVRGKSGRWYQVTGGTGFVKVWANGKIVERLCIQLNGNFPPTDSIIMRCLLIWNDEDALWATANRHGSSVVTPKTLPFKQPDLRPLTAILEEMKASTGMKLRAATSRPKAANAVAALPEAPAVLVPPVSAVSIVMAA